LTGFSRVEVLATSYFSNALERRFVQPDLLRLRPCNRRRNSALTDAYGIDSYTSLVRTSGGLARLLLETVAVRAAQRVLEHYPQVRRLRLRLARPDPPEVDAHEDAVELTLDGSQISRTGVGSPMTAEVPALRAPMIPSDMRAASSRGGAYDANVHDVVVIGGGNAALVAALTARRAAQDVLLLERAPAWIRRGIAVTRAIPAALVGRTTGVRRS
jgi:NADPH-dependent 2,4-dienoyl-CoA reductase/sulfur reductase-like enzyme